MPLLSVGVEFNPITLHPLLFESSLLMSSVTVVEIVIDVNEVHDWKAYLPISDTDVGISIDLNELHPSKARSAITETDVGIMIDLNESQL